MGYDKQEDRQRINSFLDRSGFYPADDEPSFLRNFVRKLIKICLGRSLKIAHIFFTKHDTTDTCDYN